MKNNTLFAIMCTTLIISCTKENTSEDKITFTGITKTDIQGYIISKDSTDWNFNDLWSDQETNLFTSRNNRNCLNTMDYNIIASPNPNNGIFMITTVMPKTSLAEFRLVDEKFNKLVSLDSIFTKDTFNYKRILINVTSFNKKGILRLYYKMIENNCEAIGHGDILIE